MDTEMKTGEMKTVHAIYENGVFRPLTDVELPDRVEVEFVPHPVRPTAHESRQDAVYDILAQAFDTDDPHLSQRHDEHQP